MIRSYYEAILFYGLKLKKVLNYPHQIFLFTFLVKWQSSSTKVARSEQTDLYIDKGAFSLSLYTLIYIRYSHIFHT